MNASAAPPRNSNAPPIPTCATLMMLSQADAAARQAEAEARQADADAVVAERVAKAKAADNSTPRAATMDHPARFARSGILPTWTGPRWTLMPCACTFRWMDLRKPFELT